MPQSSAAEVLRVPKFYKSGLVSAISVLRVLRNRCVILVISRCDNDKLRIKHSEFLVLLFGSDDDNNERKSRK